MMADGKSRKEGHDLTSEGHLQSKQPFGNYDLIRRIDVGGMGEVYLGYQRTAFDREVAVKIIRDDLLRDPVARARFFREAEVSSHLKHDHILPLIEFGEVQGRLFLVTPYISGGTLAQRLNAGPLAAAEAQHLFTSLAQTVAYIHRRGVIHRDLKPSNILLDDEEASEQVYVRLIDFGIATKQGAEAAPPLTKAGHEIGTLAYMAPERLDGIAAPSNDIYSLGVIFYQMLTGRLPGKEAFVVGSLPSLLEAFVRRCIAENPEDRYASVTEVIQAFEQTCKALNASAASPASSSLRLPPPAAISLQPVDVEKTLARHLLQDTGDRPTLQNSRTFIEADYVVPTMDIAFAHVGIGAEVNAHEKQHPAAVGDLSVAVPGGKRLARKTYRQKPRFVVTSLLLLVVLLGMAGMIFFEFPLGVSASVSLGSQVHKLQQVYIITARPSQTGIDVATASVPAYEEADTLTRSLTGQTSGQCSRFFFFRCRQVVAPTDVMKLSSQLRPSLISQLSAEMDNQLLALHATRIGSQRFIDLSALSNPAIGTVSKAVTMTLTEQGSVEYINGVDVQQLVRQLLAQKLGQNSILMNSTVQIGQPVIEKVTDLGTVTMQVVAVGVEVYRYPSTQLQAMLNHIKGMPIADARAYLRQQPGVDANSVSISIHTVFGDSDKLPSSVSQIKIISITSSVLPATSLPVLPTPAISPAGLESGG